MTQLETYLVTAIFTTRQKASAYQYIVDNIQKKIKGWQAKYLSVAGWVALINSTSTLIHIHAMQTTLLSQKIS